MFKVTLTDKMWQNGKTSTWTAQTEPLKWFQLKQRMGMHPNISILSIEPIR